MITSKKVYENVLVELRKYRAPHIHLDQFLYFINKGIQEFINDQYNFFNQSQQRGDALSALTVPATVTLNNTSYNMRIPGETDVTGLLVSGKRFGHDYIQIALPEQYWHLLSMFATVTTSKTYKCHPPGFSHSNSAKRFTADQRAAIANNVYLAPDLTRPYFYTQDGAFGNQHQPDLQLFYGNAAVLTPTALEFDFLKKPKEVTLTVEQRDALVDTSDVLEFPDYIVGEIIKKVVLLLLEGTKDPRLQTNPVVNQSVKN